MLEKAYEIDMGPAIIMRSKAEAHQDASGAFVDLVYGEILFDSFPALLAELNPRSGEVFCDLGSGNGKAVLCAAACFEFSQVVGVELVAKRMAIARDATQRFQSAIGGAEKLPEIVWRERDLRGLDLSFADLVFCSATCFRSELAASLCQSLETMRPGGRALILTKLLTSEALELIKEFEAPMTWGSTTAYVYRRL